jgi:hypothetical protein
MILYHGSNTEISKIDLEMCKPYKDFGKAFYLTTILQQAKEMAEKVAERFGGMPVVNTYEFDEKFASDLRVKTFSNANQEWAEFVMKNRNRNSAIMDDYDLIVGPVANDDIAMLFRTFSSGFISIDALVQGLEYRKLNNQYAFKTEKAIALLQKRESV